MASDALFLELAKALARPSRAYQAATEALQIPQQAIEGYKYGADFTDSLRKRKLEQQTLSEALGGQPLESGIMNLTGETGALQHPNIAAAIALEKERKANLPKPGDNYNAAQTEAVASGDPAKLAAAFGGVVPRTAVAANTNARGVSGRNEFYGAKGSQINLSQLPSQMPPNTAAGAAYQVKVAARQGKSLIASPGSYQRLGLTQGDAARAILRGSPTDEAMRNANFSDTLIGRYNQIKQKFSSDPTAIDQPQIRKELYDILDEMDKSATPFVANQLANRESYGMETPGDVKRRELGLDLPEIPFNMGPSTGTAKTYQKIAKNAQGVTIGTNDNWATFEPVQGGQ